MAEEYISIGRAAQILNFSVQHVRRLVSEGVLSGYDGRFPGKKRASWRVAKGSCAAFLKARGTTKTEAPQKCAS